VWPVSLSVSRSLNKFDQGIENPPASITLLKRMQETRILQETYLEGFKDGVKWLSQNKSNCKHKKSKASKSLYKMKGAREVKPTASLASFSIIL